MTAAAPSLRCRPIAEADLADVAALLAQGFPGRTRAYWRRALAVLRTREAPDGYPRYGLMLEAERDCVGVLLQIYAQTVEDGRPSVRCNVSSWYVAPAYRGYASLLTSRALRHKEVIYLNVSPAPHTWPILQAQGYRRYSDGQMAVIPTLSRAGPGAQVRRYRAGEGGFAPDLTALLDVHAAMGLTVLVCACGAERAAFAFLPRSIKGLGRWAAQLVWCADTDSFVRFAAPLGRWLLLRGFPLAILDAHGPVPGLVGRFFKDRAPKYVRGGPAPRLNDLAYTEAVLFGA